jgi:hypothetical protein
MKKNETQAETPAIAAIVAKINIKSIINKRPLLLFSPEIGATKKCGYADDDATLIP